MEQALCVSRTSVWRSGSAGGRTTLMTHRCSRRAMILVCPASVPWDLQRLPGVSPGAPAKSLKGQVLYNLCALSAAVKSPPMHGNPLSSEAPSRPSGRARSLRSVAARRGRANPSSNQGTTPLFVYSRPCTEHRQVVGRIQLLSSGVFLFPDYNMNSSHFLKADIFTSCLSDSRAVRKDDEQ